MSADRNVESRQGSVEQNLRMNDSDVPRCETWTADHVPSEAYDRLREQLARAEKLLSEVRDGKHSIPGTLVQIDRYFANRGKP